MLNAGVKVVGSFDGWPVAETIHKHNFPDVPFELRWLGKDREDDLKRMIRILSEHRAKGVHIHVHGSPPCQAFSTAGKKGKGEKTKESGMDNINFFLWLVEELKARDLCDSWSMENVIQARAHFPHLPHEILWSNDFGVPQARKRWFAGEGWSAKTSTKGLSWDEALNDPTLPSDAVLNSVGAAKSGTHRCRASDTPQGKPTRTLTRQQAVIRIPDGHGNFVKVRSLTLEEQVILHGFPKSFTQPAGTTNKNMGIALGNVVSPPVMSGIMCGLL